MLAGRLLVRAPLGVLLTKAAFYMKRMQIKTCMYLSIYMYVCMYAFLFVFEHQFLSFCAKGFRRPYRVNARVHPGSWA